MFSFPLIRRLLSLLVSPNCTMFINACFPGSVIADTLWRSLFSCYSGYEVYGYLFDSLWDPKPGLRLWYVQPLSVPMYLTPLVCISQDGTHAVIPKYHALFFMVSPFFFACRLLVPRFNIAENPLGYSWRACLWCTLVQLMWRWKVYHASQVEISYKRRCSLGFQALHPKFTGVWGTVLSRRIQESLWSGYRLWFLTSSLHLTSESPPCCIPVFVLCAFASDTGTLTCNLC